MEEIRHDVKILVSRILRDAELSDDVRDIEPTLQELLSALQDEHNDPQESVQALLGLLVRTPDGPPLHRPGIVEILEFCMRRLRWPEIHDALNELRTSARDWRVQRAAERVLEVYEEDWPGGDIYLEYRE